MTTEETSLYEYNVNSNDVFLIAYAMSREAAYGDYTDATYVGNVIGELAIIQRNTFTIRISTK